MKDGAIVQGEDGGRGFTPEYVGLFLRVLRATKMAS